MDRNDRYNCGVENVANIETMAAHTETIAEKVSSLEYRIKATIDVKQNGREGNGDYKTHPKRQKQWKRGLSSR